MGDNTTTGEDAGSNAVEAADVDAMADTVTYQGGRGYQGGREGYQQGNNYQNNNNNQQQGYHW